MSTAYLWIKVLHIVFVTSWFAGLFYLPRLFVNLAMVSPPGRPPTKNTDPIAIKAQTDHLLLMARKLYKFMGPLMVLTLVTGLLLWLVVGIGKGSIWLPVKLLVVAGLIGYHIWCGRILRSFEQFQNKLTERAYRWINEVPAVALFVAVVLVVVKPF